MNNSVIELIGSTPLVELKGYQDKYNLQARIFAKLERNNPFGSVKDRIALAMIVDGERHGKINKDTVIIEPTSGNTGIALAAVCAQRKYRLILTMPETMSVERRKLLLAYGAEIVLTAGALGIKGAVDKSLEIANGIPNSFIPDQFSNPANPKAHRQTTGVEIYQSTSGNVDIFVAGVGSGGTISGTGEYLKEKNSNIKVVAVEPFSSPLLSKGVAGPHKIQGIGANFVPKNLNKDILDEVIAVQNEDAFTTAREVAKSDAILAGTSSGAALFAAKELALRAENAGKIIVVIFPDGGEKYLSTELFNYEV